MSLGPRRVRNPTDVLAFRLPVAQGAALRRLAADQGRPYGALLAEGARRVLAEHDALPE